MAAAIIEFDALADPVGAAAQNGDFLPVGGVRLIGRGAVKRCHISRIHIGGWRGELGRAGVDALINGADIHSPARLRHIGLVAARQHGHALIRETHAFQATERFWRLRNTEFADFTFGVDNVFDLLQEPWIDFAGVMHFLDGKAKAEGLCDLQNAVGRWCAQRGFDRVAVIAEA